MPIPKIRGWGLKFSRGGRGEEGWDRRGREGSGKLGEGSRGVLQSSFRLQSLLFRMAVADGWRVAGWWVGWLVGGWRNWD